MAGACERANGIPEPRPARIQRSGANFRDLARITGILLQVLVEEDIQSIEQRRVSPARRFTAREFFPTAVPASSCSHRKHPITDRPPSMEGGIPLASAPSCRYGG